MEYLIEFGLFFGKLILVFLFFAGLIVLIAGMIIKQKHKSEIEVENINNKFLDLEDVIQSAVLDKDELKTFHKEQKETEKNRTKKDLGKNKKRRVYVLKFEGDIHAKSVDELRDEVTAVLTVAKSGDESVILIESPGGTVHGYGLAAAQLLRLKKAGILVTACVDKVAASGGYMMACTADKILSAPFAIVGSIGVIAQVPNFNRLLKKNDVDYEEISSGEYKRTVSLLGEITEKGRAKFLEQIVDTHALFKDFVASKRSNLDMSKVATGEYWYGIRAKELNLVDEIMTSDEYLYAMRKDADIYNIRIHPKKKFSDKISEIFGKSSDHILNRIYEKINERPLL